MNNPFTQLTPSISMAMQDALSISIAYIPQLIASVLVLLIGVTIASWIRKGIVKLLHTVQFSKVIADTPIESFLKHADAGKIEDVVGTTGYWLTMLVAVQTSLSILGLSALTDILGRVLAYLPSILAAIVILFFGVMIAGLVESLVKGAFKTISGSSARLLGKFSSYLVMVVTVMAAIAELRIAQQFIMILFTGFVAMTVIAFGLAFGLGSKDAVKKLTESWLKKLENDLKD